MESVREWWEPIKPYVYLGEIGVGVGLGMYSGFKLLMAVRGNFRVFRNYYNFSTMQRNKTFNYKKYISDPQLEEYVILPSLYFRPHPEHFKKHLNLIKDYRREASESRSYGQKISSSFEGYVLDNKKKIRVFCNVKIKIAFMSTSLLCNIQYCLKNNRKTDVSMTAYGKLRYDKRDNAFLFDGESFGTNHYEVYETWKTLIGVYLVIRLLFMGLGLGISACLLLKNEEAIRQYAYSSKMVGEAMSE